MPAASRRIIVAGVSVDVAARAEVLLRLAAFLADGALQRPRMVVTVNPEFVVRAQQDAEFRAALAEADMAVADGMGVVLAARILGGVALERIAGADLADDLCALAARTGARVLFLGARNLTPARAARAAVSRHPGLIVAGASEDPDDPNLPDAELVLVALGAPKQELWMHGRGRLLKKARLLVGVGGTFDYWAGNIPRAPRVVRKAGFEWLWRLVHEPRTRMRRVWNAVVRFPYIALRRGVQKMV